MPMTPFVERFPELGSRETRSATITGRDDLPEGDYAFFELYCNEPHGDCRRVMVVVLRPETGGNTFWATINYGWESREFYLQWAGAPEEDPGPWEGAWLDPLSAQSRYAPALLELFKFVLSSPGYVERLQSHYRLFRTAVERDAADRARPPRPAGVAPNPRRRKRKRASHG